MRPAYNSPANWNTGFEPLTMRVRHLIIGNQHMPQILPALYLARHGETAWSLTGQHTGLTDIPLTEHGERNAKRLGERMQGIHFDHVFTSPLVRAHHTCDLAGLG